MGKNLLENAKLLYTYAYPIVLSELVSRGTREDFLRINSIRRFVTPEDGSVIVRPNNDTLYSGGWLKLKDSPYIVEFPAVEDRYFLINALNMKTEVICSIGSRTGEINGGKYIFLYRDEEVPQGYEDYTVVRSEDSRNMFIVRVEAFGPEDYEKANRIQDQIVWKPVYPERVEEYGTKLTTPSVPTIEQMSMKEFYRNFVATFDDTVVEEDIVALLRNIGIEPKHYDYDGLPEDVKAALEQGRTEAYEEIKSYQGTEGYISNGWKIYLRGMGAYGKNYLLRAHVGWFGFGANLAEDSVYPMAFTDSEGKKLLSEGDYQLHFNAGELPHAAFFWSVTMYGEPSQGLAKNPINRYLINSHVQDSLYFNEDGSLDLILSRLEPEDKKLYNNWLPTPGDEKEFSLAMRIYGPDEDTLNGKWQAPVLKRIR